jgi:hypothetical protein
LSFQRHSCLILFGFIKYEVVELQSRIILLKNN